MMDIRRSEERGVADFGWLNSRHTFSFGSYYDPRHMGFGDLRVINEDRVRPGRGFDTHGHRDMEILSLVLSGALAHRDTLGNTTVIRPGEVQRMTAGTGIRHSEYNASADVPVHFLQIWIVPERPGLTPGYEQTLFAETEQRGQFRIVASRDGRDGSVTIHQDAAVHRGRFTAGDDATLPLAPGRRAWLQVIAGTIAVNGHTLRAGDGAALTDETEAAINAETDADVLAFDLR